MEKVILNLEIFFQFVLLTIIFQSYNYFSFIIFLLEGSWSPEDSDKKPYIQFKLNRKEPLYGITMQGSPLYDQYVTSYNVMYGDDGKVFDYVKSKKTKSPKVMNKSSKMFQL